ncbi:MAG: PAS domain-containing protein [Sedimentisphaerales bacterium]|nr:PAS domain-containing protein [Sedimentisphaerales bacterium]
MNRLIQIIKEYSSEKIVRLILFHVMVITLTAVFTTYSEYYYNEYYKKPARAKIINRDQKRILADIIQRELLSIESNYRGIVLSRNIRQLNLLKDKIDNSADICIRILDIIENGGSFTDSQPVNFYDKDEFVQEIYYTNDNKDTINVESIELPPRLIEIKNLTQKTIHLLANIEDTATTDREKEFALLHNYKQMEALLYRSREIANKIYYDIKIANIKSEKEITTADNKAIKTLVILNTVSNSLVVLLAILIVIRIASILKQQKQASQTVNTILENLPFGIFVVDKHKRIIKINKAAEQIIGRTYEEIKGKICHHYICPSQNRCCPVLDLHQTMDRSEKDIINSKGEIIPVIKTAIPLELEGQEVILEAFTDISEQKKMQELLLLAKQDIENYSQNLEKLVDARTTDLQKALANLKETQGQLLQSEKMASVGQLAAGIAHEINNPIGFIKSNLCTFRSYAKEIILLLEGYDRLIKEDPNQDSYQAIMTEVIKLRNDIDIDYIITETEKIIKDSIDGVERICNIVTDLKEFSHIDRPNACEEDINIILDKTISVAWHELKYRAKIERNYGTLPLLKCHGGQLGQVFLNILLNASDALEGKGESAVISLKTSLQYDQIIIEISDNGSGIDPEIVPKIFDPFFTTKDIGKGTGLGLNLAYKIIKAHGGQITVSSTPDSGTTFKIQLPVDEPAFVTGDIPHE